MADLRAALGLSQARAKRPAAVYDGLWARLMAGIHEPDNEQACWLWKRRLGGGGYGRMEVWVPSLRRTKTLCPHIVSWVVLHHAPDDPEEMYQHYLGLGLAGLELDHMCEDPPCINPDHLRPLTPAQNCLFRTERRRFEYLPPTLF